MLNAEEFQQWCAQCGLGAQARAVIAQIRAAPPARRVRSAAGNVSGRYPSRKMGVTIQFESHRNELAGIYEMEHAAAVLEYYDQPPAIRLRYIALTGRRVSVAHTPDFFVLRTAGAGWEEWKTEAALERLAQQSPQRYQRSAGRWRCPPGEEYAAALGLGYCLRSSAEVDWIYQRNLRFLEDYLLGDQPTVSPTVVAAVGALLRSGACLTLADLLLQPTGATADDLYTLIATQHLPVDLHAAPLAEPRHVYLGATPAGAAAGAVPRGAAHEGEQESAAAVPLAGVPLSDEAHLALQQASPAAYREANRRYACIAPLLAGQAPEPPHPPARTLREWRARYRRAEREQGCGYVGLLPHWAARGNRSRKLPERTLALLDAAIDADYETLKQKSKLAVYGALVQTCQAHGVPAPSYKTFVRAVHRRPQQEQQRKRQGPRAAYAQEPWYWEVERTTPRHGDRPFEIGHIDHTELDVELVCSQTGRPLGRPWATLLLDAFSRRILAVSLGFDPPSYRACMLVLRECVRRHARLPQTVVVDGGPEFGSTYFETLLAQYRCVKKTRPGAKPRFGSVCERLFGTTNTRFVHNLRGNTQLLAQGRQVTPAVAPQGQACWTLGTLAERLCTWAYEVYDNLPHPALGQTPRAAFVQGMAQSGARPQRLIADDAAFALATLPSTRRGTALVQPGRGIKVHYLYYWCAAFRDPGVERTAVPVRYDPYDAGTAYAFVQARWVRCIAEQYAQVRGRSEREMALATCELRRRQQLHARHLAITATQLAAFLTSTEAEEVLLIQRLRDAEARRLPGRDSGDDPVFPSTAAIAGAGPSPVAPPVVNAGDTIPAVADLAELECYEEYR